MAKAPAKKAGAKKTTAKKKTAKVAAETEVKVKKVICSSSGAPSWGSRLIA